MGIGDWKFPIPIPQSLLPVSVSIESGLRQKHASLCKLHKKRNGCVGRYDNGVFVILFVYFFTMSVGTSIGFIGLDR